MTPAQSTGAAIPVAVLGGTGYVAAELLRMLVHHPSFRVEGVVSGSRAGESVADCFPHLDGTLARGIVFEPVDSLARRFTPGQSFGIFAATPHGATAEVLDRLLSTAEKVGAHLHAVDLSADFRFRESARFEEIYGTPHPAPNRLDSFLCAVPEHARGTRPTHAAQPGCFTTAVVLGAWPFFARGLVENELFAAAVTGSSGSGRTLGSGTHHPERRSDLRAYSPLAHRHEPEMRRLLACAPGGAEPDVQFVPHSGPFVRGIHATLRMSLKTPVDAESLLAIVRDTYRGSPFVHATLDPPHLAEVVGTNRCRIGVATRGRTVVVTSVIDNLVKGAAGGAIQWMNRIFELPDETGLVLPGLGWF